MWKEQKKVAQEAIAEWVTDVLIAFWRLLWSITEKEARQHGIYLLYNKIKKQTTTEKAFFFQNLSTWLESRPLPTPPTLINTKKIIWRNLLYIQMKLPYWLLSVAKEFSLVQENHATVKLDSKVTSHGMKSHSESRIELQNLQVLKKMLEI